MKLWHTSSGVSSSRFQRIKRATKQSKKSNHNKMKTISLIQTFVVVVLWTKLTNKLVTTHKVLRNTKHRGYSTRMHTNNNHLIHLTNRNLSKILINSLLLHSQRLNYKLRLQRRRVLRSNNLSKMIWWRMLRVIWLSTQCKKLWPLKILKLLHNTQLKKMLIKHTMALAGRMTKQMKWELIRKLLLKKLEMLP